jgi:hypothetical protein
MQMTMEDDLTCRLSRIYPMLKPATVVSPHYLEESIPAQNHKQIGCRTMRSQFPMA